MAYLIQERGLSLDQIARLDDVTTRLYLTPWDKIEHEADTLESFAQALRDKKLLPPENVQKFLDEEGKKQAAKKKTEPERPKLDPTLMKSFMLQMREWREEAEKKGLT